MFIVHSRTYFIILYSVQWHRQGGRLPPPRCSIQDKHAFKCGQLILRKIIIIVATRSHILKVQCFKLPSQLAIRPRSCSESSQCSCRPPSWIFSTEGKERRDIKEGKKNRKAGKDDGWRKENGRKGSPHQFTFLSTPITRLQSVSLILKLLIDWLTFKSIYEKIVLRSCINYISEMSKDFHNFRDFCWE